GGVAWGEWEGRRGLEVRRAAGGRLDGESQQRYEQRANPWEDSRFGTPRPLHTRIRELKESGAGRSSNRPCPPGRSLVPAVPRRPVLPLEVDAGRLVLPVHHEHRGGACLPPYPCDALQRLEQLGGLRRTGLDGPECHVLVRLLAPAP